MLAERIVKGATCQQRVSAAKLYAEKKHRPVSLPFCTKKIQMGAYSFPSATQGGTCTSRERSNALLPGAIKLEGVSKGTKIMAS